MKTKNQKKILMEQIISLEHQKNIEFEILKDQYHKTIDSFKPLNLIKSALLNNVETPSLTSNIVNGTLSLGTNYLLNNFLKTKNNNPINSFVSKLIKFTFKRFVGKKQLV
jgi:hypothetical protein